LDRGRRLRAGSDYWYLNRRYSSALKEAGAAPLLLCPDTPIELVLELCTGIVLSGGGDLPHSLARGALDETDWTRVVPGEAESVERIGWERGLLDAFAQRGRSVLGVCFGMQLMNLHFGGTLRSDLASHPRPGLDHGTSENPSTHPVRLSPSSAFFSGWTPPERVSSSHRQAIATVAPGFKASAWAEDGVVEAIEHDSLIGVEWHPESDASAAFVYRRWVEQLRR
jgi:putative glutamine amidotransferase